MLTDFILQWTYDFGDWLNNEIHSNKKCLTNTDETTVYANCITIRKCGKINIPQKLVPWNLCESTVSFILTHTVFVFNMQLALMEHVPPYFKHNLWLRH